MHRDGTCDMDYDDGEKERIVEPDLIKLKGGIAKTDTAKPASSVEGS